MPAARCPCQDPILYLEGGPGGSAADPDYWLESIRTPHVTSSCSTSVGRGSAPSLDCPEVDAYLEYEDSGYDDILVAGGGLPWHRLTLDGVDVAQYNSANSAADVADLRLALGIDEWNLYGVS